MLGPSIGGPMNIGRYIALQCRECSHAEGYHHHSPRSCALCTKDGGPCADRSVRR